MRCRGPGPPAGSQVTERKRRAAGEAEAGAGRGPGGSGSVRPGEEARPGQRQSGLGVDVEGRCAVELHEHQQSEADEICKSAGEKS
jgi:hypothetical protein